MGFLAVTLSYLGYVLVYAATANHGRFAVSPWTGVTNDAYDAVTDSGGNVSNLEGIDQSTTRAERNLAEGKLPLTGMPGTGNSTNPIIRGTARPVRPRNGSGATP